MTEEQNDVWKDCNCMNCRLARIENNINKIIHIIDKLPTELGESSTDDMDIKNMEIKKC